MRSPKSLTAHLQAVSQDRHLRVRYSAEPLPEPRPVQGPGPEDEAEAGAFGRRVNLGIEGAEHFGVWVPSGRAINPITGTTGGVSASGRTWPPRRIPHCGQRAADPVERSRL